MILTDAGPLIAIIDRADADHRVCTAALRSLTGPMVTAWPALSEAVYLLGARAGWRAQEALVRVVGRGDLVIGELGRSDIERCRILMARYKSLPMDLAGAALVVLAERMDTARIFTLDADFAVYRLPRKRAFEIVPAL